MITRSPVLIFVSVSGFLLVNLTAQDDKPETKANNGVVESSNTGFSLSLDVPVGTAPSTTYECFVKNVGQWWDPDHTYSSDAANLSFDTTVDGGLTEVLPGGGFVRHLQLVNLMPGELIRLEGGLGPLQEHGVHGSMTIQFESVEEGTIIQLSYNVGGHMPNGKVTFQQWAPIVAQVIRQQLERLKIYCEAQSLKA